MKLILPTVDELKLKHDKRQIGLGSDQICIRENITIFVTPESRFAYEFFCYRCPEMAQEMDAFINYARGQSSLLDVGALYGVFSMVFAAMNPNSIVKAIEPCPSACDELNRNIVLNNWQSRIEVCCFALSNFTGQLGAKQEWEHYIVSNNEPTITIPCKTGDSIINGNKVGVIKIDVEGHEDSVLEGLQETLLQKPIVFLEFHPTINLEAIEKIIAILITQHNYSAVYQPMYEGTEDLGINQKFIECTTRYTFLPNGNG